MSDVVDHGLGHVAFVVDSAVTFEDHFACFVLAVVTAAFVCPVSLGFLEFMEVGVRVVGRVRNIGYTDAPQGLEVFIHNV